MIHGAVNVLIHSYQSRTWKENITELSGVEFEWRLHFLIVTSYNNNSTALNISSGPFVSSSLTRNACNIGLHAYWFRGKYAMVFQTIVHQVIVTRGWK